MADNVVPLKGNDPIQEAVRQLSADAGALYSKEILEQLRKMRGNNPAAFARLRAQVKETKQLSMMEFDRLTAANDDSHEANYPIFSEVEPWPEPVDGTDLLDDITHVLARHVIADKETLRTAALWAAFTWLIDAVQVAPIANITAPEKRCGKSILLTALGKLVRRPLQVANIAPAALFRSIELWSPTLLIDEVDAFLTAHEDARGILNAGFTRDSAVVLRCVGDDHIPTPFNVWGAKALCGIGKIADTLADRSVPLRLRRKTTGETVESLRHSDPALWENLRARLVRFAQDNAGAIAKARPEPIPGLGDRANDAWEPLLSIADLAGGEWPKYARNAAITLHGLEGEAPSINTELLADIKTVFEARKVSKIFSADLLEALLADDEAPWATWSRGRPMSGRQLSARLSAFKIRSKDIRQGFDVKKGYHLEQFTDAFQRYLSETDTHTSLGTPSLSATPLQASNHAAYSVAKEVTSSATKTPNATLKATTGAGCSGVALETLHQGKEEREKTALFGMETTWKSSDERGYRLSKRTGTDGQNQRQTADYLPCFQNH